MHPYRFADGRWPEVGANAAWTGVVEMMSQECDFLSFSTLLSISIKTVALAGPSGSPAEAMPIYE